MRGPDVHLIDDVRRWAAGKSLGAFRLLYILHSEIEDIFGAIEAGQFGVAALESRDAMNRSLSIRSLLVAGQVDAVQGDLAFDSWHGLHEAEVNEAMSLAAEGLDIVDVETARTWAERLALHVRETEQRLGFAKEFASVRTPEGLFPALGLAREWAQVGEELQLPPLLPKAWTSES